MINLTKYIRLNASNMDFDEYCMAITRINEELQSTADITAGQALFEVATPDNPVFVELMSRHCKLVQLSAELTDRMGCSLQHSQTKSAC